MNLAVWFLLLAVSAPGAKKTKKTGDRQTDNLIERVLAMENPQKPGDTKEDEPEPAPGAEMYPGCVDSKNIAVRWADNAKIPDVARALFDKKKRPLIEYNPTKMRFMREASRTFFFAHECGHHALGHLYGGIQGVDKEQQADCWAVHKLKLDERLHEGDLETIQQDLGTIARSDENHSAGLRRASNLKWCLTDPMPRAQEAKPEKAPLP
jgi:hypothetical protein